MNARNMIQSHNIWLIKSCYSPTKSFIELKKTVRRAVPFRDTMLIKHLSTTAPTPTYIFCNKSDQISVFRHFWPWTLPPEYSLARDDCDQIQFYHRACFWGLHWGPGRVGPKYRRPYFPSGSWSSPLANVPMRCGRTWVHTASCEWTASWWVVRVVIFRSLSKEGVRSITKSKRFTSRMNIVNVERSAIWVRK